MSQIHRKIKTRALSDRAQALRFSLRWGGLRQQAAYVPPWLERLSCPRLFANEGHSECNNLPEFLAAGADVELTAGAPLEDV